MKLVDMIGEDAFLTGILTSRIVKGSDIGIVLTQAALSNRFIPKGYCDSVIADDNKIGRYLSKKGDLVLKNVGDYTISYIVDDGIILPSFVHIIRIEDINLRAYVYMMLSSKEFYKYMIQKNGDLVIKRISLPELKCFDVGSFNMHAFNKARLFFAGEQLSQMYYDLKILNDTKKKYYIEKD